MVALFPGLPRFCSSVCIQYNTQKRKNTKNGEGLGTRLQIWLHTVSNMTLDVWLITARENAWEISMTSCGQRVDIRGAGVDRYNSQTWHWSVPSVPKKKRKLYWHSLVNGPASSPWVAILQGRSQGSIVEVPPPRISTLCLPDITTRNKISPCVFTYWKRFNTGSGQILIREVPGQGQEQRDRDRGTETEGQRQRDRDRDKV